MSVVPNKKYYLQTQSGKLLGTQSGKLLAVTMMGGGIAWNITSARELPATAEKLDICLVPTSENYPLVDTSDIKTVIFANDLLPDNGNVYPENTIMLFAKNEGVEGTAKFTVDTDYQTLRLWEQPLAASVVNVGSAQQNCEVYIYNGTEWVNAPYVQLPTLLEETLDLETWLGALTEIGTIPDLWEELGLSENYEKAPVVEGGTTETLDLETWLGKLTDFGTIDDLWVVLGLTESATQATNDGEPIPIT